MLLTLALILLPPRKRETTGHDFHSPRETTTPEGISVSELAAHPDPNVETLPEGTEQEEDGDITEALCQLIASTASPWSSEPVGPVNSPLPELAKQCPGKQRGPNFTVSAPPREQVGVRANRASPR